MKPCVRIDASLSGRSGFMPGGKSIACPWRSSICFAACDKRGSLPDMMGSLLAARWSLSHPTPTGRASAGEIRAAAEFPGAQSRRLFKIAEARKKVLKGQANFLDRLLDRLAQRK
jgi:hypothetical protein